MKRLLWRPEHLLLPHASISFCDEKYRQKAYGRSDHHATYWHILLQVLLFSTCLESKHNIFFFLSSQVMKIDPSAAKQPTNTQKKKENKKVHPFGQVFGFIYKFFYLFSIIHPRGTGPPRPPQRSPLTRRGRPVHGLCCICFLFLISSKHVLARYYANFQLTL